MNVGKEYFNKKHQQVKPLFYRKLELHYWRLLQEIQEKNRLKNLGHTLRFAIEKAAGRV